MTQFIDAYRGYQTSMDWFKSWQICQVRLDSCDVSDVNKNIGSIIHLYPVRWGVATYI